MEEIFIRRIHFVAVVTLMLSAMIFAFNQTPQPGPQVSRTATTAQPSQPVKAKRVLVRELPASLQGIKLENGVFKLQPGYKFAPQPNNTVEVRLQAGGGVSGSFDCFCSKEGGGGCSATTVGGTISCGKSKTGPCSDDCVLRTTINGAKTRLAIF